MSGRSWASGRAIGSIDPGDEQTCDMTPQQRVCAGESLHEVLGVIPPEEAVETFIDTLVAWIDSTRETGLDTAALMRERLRPVLPHHIDHPRVRDAIEVGCVHRRFRARFSADCMPKFFGPRVSAEDSRPRFELLSELGRGAQSVVWKAVDRSVPIESKQLVALKVYDKRIEQRDIHAAKVSHPNVAQLTGSGESQGQCYTAYELVSGETLSTWAQRTSPGPLVVLHLLIAITEGIVQCHNRGVIHRDLKPSNIMMSGDRPVIIDFGIAANSQDERVTEGGSPLFMAPEQAEPTPDTAQVDVYGIGGIGYYLLTGDAPNGATAEEARIRRDHRVEIDPAELRRIGFGHIIFDCLRHHPKDRIQSAGELLSDLKLYLAGMPSYRRPSLFPALRVIRRPSVALLEAGLVVLLGFLLLMSYLHTRRLERSIRSTEYLIDSARDLQRLNTENMMVLHGGDEAVLWLINELMEPSGHLSANPEMRGMSYRSMNQLREQIAELESSPSKNALSLAYLNLAHARLMEAGLAEALEKGYRLSYNTDSVQRAYQDAEFYLLASQQVDDEDQLLERIREEVAAYESMTE